MRSHGVSTKLKVRMVYTFVFPVVLYGSESWTVKKSDEKKIEAFEMWGWRRVLRISWKEKVSNKLVLVYAQPKMSLMSLVVKMALWYFGHINRANGLEVTILTGKVEGRRKRGRQRTRWVDFLQKETGKGLQELQRMTLQRNEWRAFVHRITESRRRLTGT